MAHTSSPAIIKNGNFPPNQSAVTQVKAVVNVKHRSGIRTDNENAGPAQWVSMSLIYFMNELKF